MFNCMYCMYKLGFKCVTVKDSITITYKDLEVIKTIIMFKTTVI